jgi:hypothetical protein
LGSSARSGARIRPDSRGFWVDLGVRVLGWRGLGARIWSRVTGGAVRGRVGVSFFSPGGRRREPRGGRAAEDVRKWMGFCEMPPRLNGNYGVFWKLKPCAWIFFFHSFPRVIFLKEKNLSYKLSLS